MLASSVDSNPLEEGKYAYGSGTNNMDIFKKINALLDNTLDLNSLAAAVNSVTNVQSTDVQSASSYPKSKSSYNVPSCPDYGALFAVTGEMDSPGGSSDLRYSGNQSSQSGNYSNASNQHGSRPMNYNQQSSFISGAISNRTLEQLTEALVRPVRAIKSEQKNSYSETPATPSQNTDAYSRNFNRSSSPSDSDTSGVGTSSDVSDNALMDLMNSLSISQSNVAQPNILHQQVHSYAQHQPVQHHQPQHTQQHHVQQQAQVQSYQPQYQQQMHQQQQQQQQQQIQQQLQQHQQQQQQYQIQQQLLQNSLASLSPQVDLLRALGLQTDPGPICRPEQSSASSVDMSQYNLDLNMADKRWNSLNMLFAPNNNDPYSIERAAKLYRNAATICKPTCTWSGQLPPKVYRNPTYSCKVFLGGMPWDITEAGLQTAFKTFGPMKIEWPGKDGRHPRYPPKAGYVYVLFENEKSVRSLLQACTHDYSTGEYYIRISSRRMKSKEVQVVPWVLSDSNFVRQPSQRLDPTKTVFVGALHGMMTAEGLAHFMNDLFGNVVYAGIDTDKHKYPIGSGRVTFSSQKSYMDAVNASFVEVKTQKFTKKVQIDPYLEDSVCQTCNLQPGPFFCRELVCFRYYCRMCWHWVHSLNTTSHHKPLMRNNKSSGGAPSTVSSVF